MKKNMNAFRWNILAVLLLVQISVYSEPIDFIKAKQAATNKISELNKSNHFSILEIDHIYSYDSDQVLFYIFELNPVGYIVVSAETNLPPIIAYSFHNSFKIHSSDDNPLVQLLLSDIKLRIENVSILPETIIHQRNNCWENLLSGDEVNKSGDLFQQWPPEGTTLTGGWLETNWTQNPPYNNFCPVDPVTGNRSIAGCPAVALAMIINYYETINGIIFTDSDDYYHSYAGRNYWIDDDYLEHDFPSFPIMNAHLDTLTNCYLTNTPLKENEKAAITFACGVAATQVYTSSISGTFGVSQAYDAYLRFDFQEAVLLNDNDTSLYTVLSQNMMDARPVHLAVVDPPVTMGHNVVIDGYNTDEYYHLNFGWGGSYNGWYLLPDEIPYGLTVIEGAIANIAYPPVISGTYGNTGNVAAFSLSIDPNPVTSFASINYIINERATAVLKIYNSSGQLIENLRSENIEAGNHHYTWYINSRDNKIEKGIYFCRLQVNDKAVTKKFIIR